MERPRHPYTVGLLQSIPKFGQRVERLAAIPGSVPSLLDGIEGCPFHNRCAFAQDRCRKEMPRLEEAEAGHEVACFHPVVPTGPGAAGTGKEATDASAA